MNRKRASSSDQDRELLNTRRMTTWTKTRATLTMREYTRTYSSKWSQILYKVCFIS